MKILDRTPYRTESGEINIIGRVRGSLQFGLSWYARLQAQDTVITIMDKVLKEGFVLVRNATLPDTEITLPLVLIAPQGVFLISVTHERGVYRAKDDEWGTVVGEKFVPAAINQVQRTLKLGRVLQVYLDRNGFKDLSLVVDPILMSADPGTHIDSTRPAVRIIMSDALERFAISLSQGRATLNANTIFKITKMILEGPTPKEEAVAPAVSTTNRVTPASGGMDTTEAIFSDSSAGGAALNFSFDEAAERQPVSSRPAPQASPTNRQPATTQKNAFEETSFEENNSQNSPFLEGDFGNAGFQESPFQSTSFQEAGEQSFETQNTEARGFAFDAQPENVSKPKPSAPKKKGRLGMTTPQILILAAVLFFWLCAMAAFAVYIFYFA